MARRSELLPLPEGPKRTVQGAREARACDGRGGGLRGWASTADAVMGGGRGAVSGKPVGPSWM